MPGTALLRLPLRNQRLTLESLACETDLHPDLVERYVAYGLLEPATAEGPIRRFDVTAVRRLRTICRLREDLGINLAGIAVVLDLLERIEALQRELKTRSSGNSNKGTDRWT